MIVSSPRSRSRRSRPARLVTVCIAGHPATQERFNTTRIELANKLVREVRRRAGWASLDAILFPAGYFRLNRWFGPLASHDRIEQIAGEEIGEVTHGMAAWLSRTSPGCIVAVGVDTSRSPDGWRGDQLVLACNADGVAALARKVFPVSQDTDEWGRAPYLLFEHDAGAPDRFVQLANGETALLSACYDAFVLTELVLGPTSKRRAMRFLGTPGSWRFMNKADADRLLETLAESFRRHRPTINLAAIHGFRRPGGDLYWQRHGLATASAALGGGLSVGAAHFTETLPDVLSPSTLAACGVPLSALHARHNRTAHSYAPNDGFVSALPGHRSLRALVRLYEAL